MTADEAKRAAKLCEAIADFPSVRRRLAGRPAQYCDDINLELVAADMADGVGQGSSAYLYLPVDVGQKILNAAEAIVREELKQLGVEPGKKARRR